MWLNENECSDEELVLFTSNSDYDACENYKS